MTAPVVLPLVRDETAHVTPGILDGETDRAYRNGQCLALALALHEQTGWPVVLHLSDPDWWGDTAWETDRDTTRKALSQPRWYDDVAHALVLSPAGWLVDIQGAHDPDGYIETARDAHGNCALVQVDDPDDLADLTRYGGLPPQDHRTARATARALLATI